MLDDSRGAVTSVVRKTAGRDDAERTRARRVRVHARTSCDRERDDERGRPLSRPAASLDG